MPQAWSLVPGWHAGVPSMQPEAHTQAPAMHDELAGQAKQVPPFWPHAALVLPARHTPPEPRHPPQIFSPFGEPIPVGPSQPTPALHRMPLQEG